MKIYLNGSLWLSDTGKTKTIGEVSAATLGSALNTNHYDGVIDNVYLYDAELSASEIQDIYLTSQP